MTMLKGVKVTGMELVTCEIPNTLEALQKLVGGYIEIVRLGEGIIGVCNEEGMLLDLPANLMGYRGDLFICRTNPVDGEMVSLTPQEQKEIIEQLRNRYLRSQMSKVNEITERFMRGK